jgi:hypothetical protein
MKALSTQSNTNGIIQCSWQSLRLSNVQRHPSCNPIPDIRADNPVHLTKPHTYVSAPYEHTLPVPPIPSGIIVYLG